MAKKPAPIKPKHDPIPFDPEHSAFAVPDGTLISALSDLHYGVFDRKKLGGKNAKGENNAYTDNEVSEIVKQAIRNVGSGGHMVLNGDIFEHMMHKYKNKAAARGDFVKVMEEWIAVAEEIGAKLHYVGGNHDDGKKLIAVMQEMDQEHAENFAFHPVALRLGPLLFTHGDLPMRSGADGINAFGRIPSNEKFITHRVQSFLFGAHTVPDPDDDGLRSSVIHSIESRLSALGIQKAIQLVEDKDLPPSVIAGVMWKAIAEAAHTHPELMRAIEKMDGNIVPEVSRIVTGHTHIPFTGVRLDLSVAIHYGHGAHKILFDGTGSPMQKDRLNMMCYTVKGKQAAVEQVQVSVDAHHSVTLTTRNPEIGFSR